MKEEKSSRWEGFYRLGYEERLSQVQEFAALSPQDEAALRGEGGLGLDEAQRMIENVVGLYSLPLGLAVNFCINGRDYLIPMAIEEPSVVAGASYAAKLVREGGGFTAGSTDPVMMGQIQLLDVEDLALARERILARGEEIQKLADAQHPAICALGGGSKGLEVKIIPESRAGPMLVVHLLYDTRDAMGANAVNSALEAIAPLVAQVARGRANLRIISNLADRRLAWARCRVPAAALARDGWSGAEAARRIVEASALAEVDPYRAATHNKGLMNGIDAVALATGNDWRALEAGAHAYAARNGSYGPLSRWELEEDGTLSGSIELPVAIGTVGGATQAHPVARVALKILGVEGARELAQIVAAVGLAQNLAALRALAMEGIQAGHMALHARQVAMAAGAEGEAIDRVAEQLVRDGRINLRRAREILAEHPKA